MAMNPQKEEQAECEKTGQQKNVGHFRNSEMRLQFYALLLRYEIILR